MFAEDTNDSLPEQQVEATVTESVPDAPQEETNAPEVADAVEAIEAEAAEPAKERAPNPKRERRQDSKRPPKERRDRDRKPRRAAPLIFKRFVVVRWSGRREPVDDMFWAEAKLEGDWIVISEFEQVRSRKEILTKLQELPNGLVAFDFPFSYPTEFLEMLKAEGISDWRSLIKTARDDLKKNTDDGSRLWIERMGRYRESRLDAPPPQRDFRGRLQRPLPPPYEQQSVAERYRRTDHTVRRAANRHLISPVQIGYNKLTSRYEFTDPQGQGRAALLGMAMFDQLLESRDDVAVWPMMAPKPLTIVEVLPWVFTEGERVKPEVVRQQLSLLEDRGWEIPSEAVDLAARNTDAQNALRVLIGMIKTESREDRQRRPIRDYLPQFYEDQQVKQEGWFYSVGYRLSDDKKSESPSKNGKQEHTKQAEAKIDAKPEASAQVSVEVPANTPSEPPVEATAEVPSEAPSEVSSEASDQS
jgi:hypothetical protein